MRRCYSFISVALAVLTVGAVAAPGAGAATHHSRARHVVGHARTLSFYATVVRADSKGLLVRTKSGRVLQFSPDQISRTRSPLAKHRRHQRRRHHLHAANDAQFQSGPVVINIVGLQPGVTVLITETIGSDGTITVTITLPPVPGSQSASGVVTNVETDAFDVTTGDGTDLRLHMAADALSNLNLQTCDTVDVSYHQDAGMLVADNVQLTGASSAGDCAPTYDASGPITSVSGSSITINSDQGPMTFSVSSSDLTDGFQIGDVVDVTYTQNSDGSLAGQDVEYVEQDASGIVTSVSPSALTITDSSTGQADSFIADPSNGLELCTYAFDGLHVGDQVDVTYHQTAAGLVADSVDDQGPAS